ncbi:MAG: TIGR01777 family oxidoreductase [Opitutaceae bacterium]|nr:TIGR01777 family oxidoreductase [Opitutaceae bacterium]
MNATHASPAMTVLMAGASGLVGRVLAARLTDQGHRVLKLVRRPAVTPDEISWNPGAGEIAPGAFEEADAVINLAGENLAAGRWTARRREAILRSRVDTTRTLVAAVREAKRRPAVFVNASATGIYGDRGDEVLTEASVAGTGFLADVCRAWEEPLAAAPAGVRTVALRTGVVLTPQGGALAKMLPAFRVGVGGRLGNGRQWMSWITLEDLLGVIGHVLTRVDCRGAINAVAPQPVTNADFTTALGRVLGRPTVLPVPAFALRLLFGQMADEALLSSTRVEPKILMDSEFQFRHAEVAVPLRDLLGSGRKA